MATRTTSNPRQRPSPSSGNRFWRGLLILAIGFTGGLGVAAFIAVKVNELPIPLKDSPTRDSNFSRDNDDQRTQREALEFHETLRQRRNVKPSATIPDTPQASFNFVYYLQLGAFSNRGAAEALRAEVALLGMPTIIKTGQSNNGEDIFQVWTGPYSSPDKADESRAQLALNGYNNVQLLKLAENTERNNTQ